MSSRRPPPAPRPPPRRASALRRRLAPCVPRPLRPARRGGGGPARSSCPLPWGRPAGGPGVARGGVRRWRGGGCKGGGGPGEVRGWRGGGGRWQSDVLLVGGPAAGTPLSGARLLSASPGDPAGHLSQSRPFRGSSREPAAGAQASVLAGTPAPGGRRAGALVQVRATWAFPHRRLSCPHPPRCLVFCFHVFLFPGVAAGRSEAHGIRSLGSRSVKGSTGVRSRRGGSGSTPFLEKPSGLSL